MPSNPLTCFFFVSTPKSVAKITPLQLQHFITAIDIGMEAGS